MLFLMQSKDEAEGESVGGNTASQDESDTDKPPT